MDLGQMSLERQRRGVALAEGRASEDRIKREVGQAFHIHGAYPDGVWLWGLGLTGASSQGRVWN
jgi:hypothetical protein